MKQFRHPISAVLFLFCILSQLLLTNAVFAASEPDFRHFPTPLEMTKNNGSFLPEKLSGKPMAAFPQTSKLTRKNVARKKKPFNGGPSTPEVQGFTPYDANNLVDPFTGDFNFNIPLLDVGGYPINLSYTSTGITPESEASFVGLGWNLNPGAINRQVRGLPDDLNGEMVKKTMNIKDEEKIGVNTGFSVEVIGIEGANLGGSVQLGVTHSNYEGFDVEASIAPSISADDGNTMLSGGLTTKIGISSRSGGFLEPEVGFSAGMSGKKGAATVGIGLGTKVGSVEGMESIDFEASVSTKNVRLHVGSAFNFANPTYAPTFEMPQTHGSGSLSIKIGGELTFVALGGSIGGFYSKKWLTSNTDAVPAFGYMYAQNATGGKVLMDYNREKDGAYIKDNPNLPLTNFTYDLYSVSGQGFSEQFRPHRGDIGTVFDTEHSNTDGGGSLGAEVSFGNQFHVGVDIAANYNRGETKRWTDGNGLRESFQFKNADPGNLSYEPVYFKGTGEKTVLKNQEIFNAVGGFEAVTPKITGTGNCGNTLFTQTKALPLRTNYTNQIREPRNLHCAWLTGSEARNMGIQKHIVSEYIANDGVKLDYPIDRVGTFRQAHHLSEAIVTRDDGTRYVYGLPAYNVVQKEVSFSVELSKGNILDKVTNLVSYTKDVDNSTANTKGDSHYFSAQEMPPYAYAYLLTAVLSADYIDITGNGPTADDFGTYTKFNYKKAQDEYAWRIPYEKDKAVFNAVHDCAEQDDMASYTYGEKEIWYISSIETRNYIAEFTVNGDNRADGLGVIDENGGKAPAVHLQQLNRISLYAIHDRQTQKANAVPIKSVYFEYDHALCPNNPSSSAGKGKLTLKKLSFSYADSEKERFSPYEFFYDNNPAYKANQSDRWGTYKEPLMADLGNARFPYAEKDKTRADRFASAWLLSRIKMPSGDTISVEYEADDYAFVQNKRALEMVPVVGFANNILDTPADTLFNGGDPYKYLFFKLKTPILTNDDNEVRKYVAGIQKLYFNCMVQIRPNLNGYEAIGGFTDVNFEKAGVDFGRKDANTGWIKIPAVPKGNAGDSEKVNPISKAAWQTLRKELSKYLLESDIPDYTGTHSDVTAFLEAAANVATQLPNVFKDIYTNLRDLGKGKLFKPAESFIRLNSPDGLKRGGGARVKRLRVNDAWGTMQQTPHLNFNYIQEYDYSMSAPNDVYSGLDKISSGVAAYEPLIGGDENPFAMPIEFTVHKLMAIDLFENLIQPFGESFFPAPTVGYSSVSVRNVPKPGIQMTATGRTQYEFYTAKDFPTLVRYTDKSEVTDNPFPISAVFFAYSKNEATVAQGYAIEINDMHGKSKAMRVFDEWKNQISAQEYFYKTDPNNPNHLDNIVTVINENTGAPENQMFGVEYDMILDAREFFSETHGPAMQINGDGSWFGPVLVPLVLPYPSYSTSFSRYRGLVITKVISRAGLLEKVVSWKLGSSIAARNIAWDGLSGAVVLTETENEYGGYTYDTKIPTEWVYPDGMGMAYKNTGLKETLQINNGIIPYSALINPFLVAGDELMMYRLDSMENVLVLFSTLHYLRSLPPFRAWVLGDVPNQGKSIIDEDGLAIPKGLYALKIIRSGRRNMQALMVGNVISTNNPLQDIPYQLSFKDVLDASALEYSNYWQTYTGFTRNTPTDTCSCSVLVDNLKVLSTLVKKLLSNPDFRSEGVNINAIPERSVLMGAVGTAINSYSVRQDGPNLFVRIVGNTGSCDLTISRADGQIFSDIPLIIDSGSASIKTDSTQCADSYTFKLKANYQDSTGAHSMILNVSTSCVKLMDCTNKPAGASIITCSAGAGNVINPYLTGILGNWRASASYKYVTNRLANENPEKRGIYEDFANFWIFPNAFKISPAVSRSLWQNSGQSTIIDPYGKILESRDPLGRFSAELQGYGFSLATATLVNSRYNQSAFDGFEDYYYRNTASTPFKGGCTLPPHFKVPSNIFITNEQGHTGKSSVLVVGKASVTRVSMKICENDHSTWNPEKQYRVQDCDLIKPFAPLPGKYFLSVWVKDLPASTANVQIRLKPTIGPEKILTIATRGPVIEDWQQISDTLEIPKNTELMEVIFNSPSTGSFFDDFRIQPFNASMQAYVYDAKTVRLMAVLDENNYSTLYEYDYEGLLTRVKKETEQGILTIKEIRNSKPKK